MLRGLALWIVMSFFVLAMMNVNGGAVIFCFLVIFAASWGAQGYEVGNTIANERIFAEFVGVAIALIAVSVRNILGTPIDARRDSADSSVQSRKFKGP